MTPAAGLASIRMVAAAECVIGAGMLKLRRRRTPRRRHEREPVIDRHGARRIFAPPLAHNSILRKIGACR
jgi:hypothetical protein